MKGTFASQHSFLSCGKHGHYDRELDKSLFEHTSFIISLLLSHGGPHIQSSVECMLPNPIVCPRVKPRGPPVIAKTHRAKPHLHRLSGCITAVPSATRSENKACAHFTRWRVIQNDGSCSQMRDATLSR